MMIIPDHQKTNFGSKTNWKKSNFRKFWSITVNLSKIIRRMLPKFLHKKHKKNFLIMSTSCMLPSPEQKNSYTLFQKWTSINRGMLETTPCLRFLLGFYNKTKVFLLINTPMNSERATVFLHQKKRKKTEK